MEGISPYSELLNEGWLPPAEIEKLRAEVERLRASDFKNTQWLGELKLATAECIVARDQARAEVERLSNATDDEAAILGQTILDLQARLAACKEALREIERRPIGAWEIARAALTEGEGEDE